MDTMSLVGVKGAMRGLADVLGRPSSRLVDNVVLNELAGPGDPTHLEVTKETVRVEYTDGNEKQYQEWAKICAMTKQEKIALGIPRHLWPIDVVNRTYCGAGATVILDRVHIATAIASTVDATDTNRNILEKEERKKIGT